MHYKNSSGYSKASSTCSAPYRNVYGASMKPFAAIHISRAIFRSTLLWSFPTHHIYILGITNLHYNSLLGIIEHCILISTSYEGIFENLWLKWHSYPWTWLGQLFVLCRALRLCNVIWVIYPSMKFISEVKLYSCGYECIVALLILIGRIRSIWCACMFIFIVDLGGLAPLT